MLSFTGEDNKEAARAFLGEAPAQFRRSVDRLDKPKPPDAVSGGRPGSGGRASEKPVPLSAPGGRSRRDSYVRGRCCMTQRANRWSRAQGHGSCIAQRSRSSNAHLPRSPTGLADGFGAKECAVQCSESEHRIHPKCWVPRSRRNRETSPGIRPNIQLCL